jgi:iron complex transport system substrate-binding protein
MTRFKRLLQHLILTAGFGLLCAMAQAEPIQVTDVTGRSVTLPQAAERIVLAQARHLPVLALLHPDPVSILVGWSDEFRTSFSNDYQDYLKVFPAIADVAVIGRHTADTFSLEKTLALRPDLVVLTSSFAGIMPGQDPDTSPLIRNFQAAGVPVIVVDFFVNPLENTVPSLRALSSAIGRQEQGEALIQFYQERMQRIADRIATLDETSKPPVLVHAHAGTTDCCNSPGTGTFNDMISYAGGHNIGSDAIKNATGRLSLEYISSRNPSVYVATGTGAKQRMGSGLTIGSGATLADAQASLQRVINANRLNGLSAARTGNAHGIWHAFNDSPLHVIFIEALASWIHPELFHDVSPQASLNEVNARFLTVPMKGVYMVDLSASDKP